MQNKLSRPWILGLVSIASLFSFSACGASSNKESVSKGAHGNLPVLNVAARTRPSTVDPLTVTSEDGLELSRQIHEPLVEQVESPRAKKRLSGLVLSWKKSRSGRVWLAWLRPGVRFQDGAKLDAGAVATNARRWITTSAGRAQIGVLRSVSARARSLVRFSLTRPVDNLPYLLSAPRLALVSPAAMSPRDGRQAVLTRQVDTGTGPFQLSHGGTREGRVSLGQNTHWWARARGVTPAIRAVTFSWQPDELKRVKSLLRGKVSVVLGVTQIGVTRLAGDPNIQLLGTLASREYGAVRWLRGLTLSPLGAESFAGVWITRAD